MYLTAYGTSAYLPLGLGQCECGNRIVGQWGFKEAACRGCDHDVLLAVLAQISNRSGVSRGTEFHRPQFLTCSRVKSSKAALRGPLNWNLDVALSRRLQFGEKRRIELRAESFNVLNRFRPNDLNTTLNNTNFGRITSAQDPRIMQFAVKYVF